MERKQKRLLKSQPKKDFNLVDRKCWKSLLTTLALTVAPTLGVVGAQTSDPLLDLLLNKGMITEQEAAIVKAEADAIRTNGVTSTSTKSKWDVKSGMPGIELFGDLRLRYEGRKGTDPYGGDIKLQRLRYSARFGIRGEVLDDFYYGFRMETSGNPRSSWLTAGANSSSSGTYQGPFGKTTASLDVGQLYLGWKGADWLNLTVGKMPNPLYTTPMIWDSDINPEGFAEHFTYTVGAADLFANFGQFLYQDTNPTKASGGFFNLDYNSSNLPFLMAWQGGVNYRIATNITFKVAPVLYQYTGHGVNQSSANPPEFPGFSGTFIGQGSTNGVDGSLAGYSGYPNGPYDGFVANQTGINDLLIIDIPFELDVRLASFNLRFLGDYAQNLQGAERAQAAYNAQFSSQFSSSGLLPIPSPQTKDVKAYRIGVAFNNLPTAETSFVTKRRQWEFITGWQHIEQYALDPNLLDSDIFEGRGNLQGVYAGITYGLTDNFVSTLRYAHAWRINDQLGTGGSNLDLPQMNPINHFNLLQLDLSLRF